MDLGIEGKAALVVAGSRGLGRATADALAAEGVRVLLSSRNEESLARARASLRALGAEVETRADDITDPDAPRRLVEATVEAFGSIDIVVPNAGGPPPGRALDLNDAALVAALNANLLASVRLTREALPFMRAVGWGRICCITS